MVRGRDGRQGRSLARHGRGAPGPARTGAPPRAAGERRARLRAVRAQRPAPGKGRPLSRAVPASQKSRLRILIGAVALLAVLLVAGVAWLLLPRASPPARGPVVLETEVPGGVSDPDTAIRIPKEAIAVTSSFTLFDGKDPTVFAGDPDNPVRFDGELARIATSVASAGAKVVIGAGLSSRLAGQTVRVTIEARSARENGASTHALRLPERRRHQPLADGQPLVRVHASLAWSGGCRCSAPAPPAIT